VPFVPPPPRPPLILTTIIDRCRSPPLEEVTTVT
jgi:hypothetical protein